MKKSALLLSWLFLCSCGTDSGEEFFARGMWRLRQKQEKGAIQDFEEATARLPGHFHAHLELGKARIRSADKLRKAKNPAATEELRKAVRALERAESIDPRDQEPPTELGNALYRLGILTRERAYHEQARDAHSRTLAIVPDHQRALAHRGNALRDLGDLKGAVSDWTRALELDPKDDLTRRNRVGALHSLGEHERAAQDYSVIASRTNLWYDWLALAHAHNRLKRYKEALAAYDKAIALQPTHPSALASRGLCRRSAKDHEGAAADFSRALLAKPDYASAYVWRAQAYEKLIRWDAAIGDVDSAIRLTPDNVSLYTFRARLHSRRASWWSKSRIRTERESALKNYEEATARKPGDPVLIRYRGSARMDLGDIDGAIADYTQAIALDPLNGPGFFYRANALRRKGEIDDAVADCIRSQILWPEHARSFEMAGELRMKQAQALVNQGRREEAVEVWKSIREDYRAAVRLRADRPSSFMNLANAHRWCGEWEQAIEAADQAIALTKKLPWAYYHRAAARASLSHRHSKKMDLLRQADQDYTIALKSLSKSYGVYHARGNVRKWLGDLQGAAADYRTALRLAPKKWSGRKTLEKEIQGLIGSR